MSQVKHRIKSAPNSLCYFGELALMYSRPRAATVMANTKGVLFSLNRVAFNVILKRSTFNPIISTLRSVSIFNTLNNIQIQALSTKVKQGKYSNGDVILKEGNYSEI